MIKHLLEKYEPVQENIINILHEVQNNNPLNYITEDAMREVAAYLNLTYSSVYGVVKYYSMFSDAPRAQNIIRFCVSPVCHMLNAEDLLDYTAKQLKVKLKEPSSDQLFYLETTECLGHCEGSPAMMINQEMYTDLDKEKIKDILETYRKK